MMCLMITEVSSNEEFVRRKPLTGVTVGPEVTEA